MDRNIAALEEPVTMIAVTPSKMDTNGFVQLTQRLLSVAAATANAKKVKIATTVRTTADPRRITLAPGAFAASVELAMIVVATLTIGNVKHPAQANHRAT